MVDKDCLYLRQLWYMSTRPFDLVLSSPANTFLPASPL